MRGCRTCEQSIDSRFRLWRGDSHVCIAHVHVASNTLCSETTESTSLREHFYHWGIPWSFYSNVITFITIGRLFAEIFPEVSHFRINMYWWQNCFSAATSAGPPTTSIWLRIKMKSNNCSPLISHYPRRQRFSSKFWFCNCFDPISITNGSKFIRGCTASLARRWRFGWPCRCSWWKWCLFRRKGIKRPPLILLAGIETPRQNLISDGKWQTCRLRIHGCYIHWVDTFYRLEPICVFRRQDLGKWVWEYR